MAVTVEAYMVVTDTSACERCGAGHTWTICGPDGVNGSTSYADEADAEHEARCRACEIAGEVVNGGGFTAKLLRKCSVATKKCPEFGGMLLLSLWNELTKGTSQNPYVIHSPGRLRPR